MLARSIRVKFSVDTMVFVFDGWWFESSSKQLFTCTEISY